MLATISNSEQVLISFISTLPFYNLNELKIIQLEYANNQSMPRALKERMLETIQLHIYIKQQMCGE